MIKWHANNIEDEKKKIWIRLLAIVCGLSLVIGLTYAWFFQQSNIATMITIMEPSTIAIGGPNGSDLISLDLSYTEDNVTLDENGNRKVTIQRVISVISGDNENKGCDKQKLEIIHTTNMQNLMFEVYETKENGEIITENDNTFYYDETSKVKGTYMNKGTSENGYNYADSSRHSNNYEDGDEVQSHAEPLYWISESLDAELKQSSDKEYMTNYVVQISWTEKEKETDIFYVLAQGA